MSFHQLYRYSAYYLLRPGAINAVNLLDGLDGLASGVAFISSLGFLIVSVHQENTFAMILSLALMGTVLGFLRYNFNPASIFMGNCGSSFLGYILAALTIIFTNRPYELRCFVAPILIMGLPVLDTALTIIRRYRKNHPLFMGDRSHIYDRLVDRGFSVRQTAWVCYVIQAVLVGAGVVAVIYK